MSLARRPLARIAPRLAPRITALLATLAALACGDPSGPGAPKTLTELPRALTTAERGTIGASNTFGFDLLREVNATHADENVFISPLSASMALGMTMNGAAGGTQEGMKKALALEGMAMADVNASYRSLIDLLLGLDPSVEFRIANSIWARQGFPFEPSFFDVTRQSFDATVEQVDFTAPATLGRINGWASEKTNKRIPKILDRLSPDLVMVLMNAIYFKGAWRTRFATSDTRSQPFHLDGGATKSVPMMSARDVEASVGQDGQTRVLELPYGNSAFVMTVVLPPAGTDVDAFAASLDAAAWERLVGSLHEGEVDVTLPKLRIEWEDELNGPLARMGMADAFSSPPADFTNLSKSRGRELFISFVKQKTFVDVNEEGTEAAAVTAVGIELTSAGPPPFVVDRPFVFALRERLSGTVLFLGKIVSP